MRSFIANEVVGNTTVSSSLTVSARESSPAAWQLVLKTKMHVKAWGLDTSTLRHYENHRGI